MVPVKLNSEVIHRYVCEIRYDLGQVYWDRAGRIATEVLSDKPGWDFENIDMNNCQLSNRDQNLVLNFGPVKLDVSQTQNADVDALIPIGEFGKRVEELSSTVVRYLELKTFPRIGFRAWYLYPAESRERSHDMIRNLEVFSIKNSLIESLGQIRELSHTLVVDRPTHMLRVAVSAFEQTIAIHPSVLRAANVKSRNHSHGQRQLMIDGLKAKKKIEHYPQFGVLLDLDAHIEDPPLRDELSVSDWIGKVASDFAAVKKCIFSQAQDRQP